MCIIGLCLSDKFSCTGRFPCTPKITCLLCSRNKLLLWNFEFGRVFIEISFERRKIYTAHKIDKKVKKSATKQQSYRRHIPKCSTISLHGLPDIKLLSIVVIMWTGIILLCLEHLTIANVEGNSKWTLGARKLGRESWTKMIDPTITIGYIQLLMKTNTFDFGVIW